MGDAGISDGEGCEDRGGSLGAQAAAGIGCSGLPAIWTLDALEHANRRPGVSSLFSPVALT
jgi:hypothetical protein